MTRHPAGISFLNLPSALHLDASGPPVAIAQTWQVAQPDSHQEITWLEKSLINMSNLPKYYFHDLPAYVMEEIITGMINGRPEPTRQEMQDWLAEEMEREAEALLAANG